MSDAKLMTRIFRVIIVLRNTVCICINLKTAYACEESVELPEALDPVKKERVCEYTIATEVVFGRLV